MSPEERKKQSERVKKTNAKRVEERREKRSPLPGEYIAVDNSTLNEVLLELQKIYAQNKVLVTRLHNQHVELSGLKANLDSLLAALALVMQEPTKLGDLEAVLRDFLFQKHKKD